MRSRLLLVGVLAVLFAGLTLLVVATSLPHTGAPHSYLPRVVLSKPCNCTDGKLNNRRSTSDGVVTSAEIKPVLKVAYLISIVKDYEKPWVLADSLFTLSWSIRRSGSKYPADLVAVIDPGVKNRKYFAPAGWQVIEADSPVKKEEIKRRSFAEEASKSGCCGLSELLKLKAFEMTQYDKVVSLDMDTVMQGHIDEILEMPETLIYTTNPAMGASSLQGGWFVVRPNLEIYNQIRDVIREGNFDGSGWEKSGIGYFWGGPTIQGILPYFFKMRLPRELSRVVDVCRYNNMAEHKRCEEFPPEQSRMFHFTVCQKPWTCSGFKRNSVCKYAHDRWWTVANELQTEFGISPRPRCPNKRYSPMAIDDNLDKININRAAVALDSYSPSTSRSSSSGNGNGNGRGNGIGNGRGKGSWKTVEVESGRYITIWSNNENGPRKEEEKEEEEEEGRSMGPHDLERKQLLACLVVSDSQSMDRMMAITLTWGGQCDTLIFLVEKQTDREKDAPQKSKFPPYIASESDYLFAEERMHLSLVSRPSTLSSWQYLFNNYRHSHSFFLKVPHDTYVFIPNLRRTLLQVLRAKINNIPIEQLKIDNVDENNIDEHALLLQDRKAYDGTGNEKEFWMVMKNQIKDKNNNNIDGGVYALLDRFSLYHLSTSLLTHADKFSTPQTEGEGLIACLQKSISSSGSSDGGHSDNDGDGSGGKNLQYLFLQHRLSSRMDDSNNGETAKAYYASRPYTAEEIKEMHAKLSSTQS